MQIIPVQSEVFLKDDLRHVLQALSLATAAALDATVAENNERNAGYLAGYSAAIATMCAALGIEVSCERC